MENKTMLSRRGEVGSSAGEEHGQFLAVLGDAWLPGAEKKSGRVPRRVHTTKKKNIIGKSYDIQFTPTALCCVVLCGF